MATCPSGRPSVVSARSSVLRIRRGPGFLPALAPVIRLLRVARLPDPILLNFVYIGQGSMADHVHPSPWFNPWACCTSSSERMTKYLDYIKDRADAPEWLAPLAGMTLIAEEGPTGDHAEVLADFIEALSSPSRENMDGDIFDDTGGKKRPRCAEGQEPSLCGGPTIEHFDDCSPRTKHPRCAKGPEPLLCGGCTIENFDDDDDDTSFNPNHSTHYMSWNLLKEDLARGSEKVPHVSLGQVEKGEMKL